MYKIMNQVFIINAIKIWYEFNEQKSMYNVRLHLMLISSIADVFQLYDENANWRH